MSNSNFFNLKRYKLGNKIGEGGFGIVYQVTDKVSGEYFAAKISKNQINFENDENEENPKNQDALILYREINLMALLNFPSILKFVGYSQTDFDGNLNPTIITEYSVNGSLDKVLTKEISGISPNGWNFTKKLINMYGIARGMLYLHNNEILHRDLKPQNILIDEFFYPKIADFGLSKITDLSSSTLNFQSVCDTKGTPLFMSPEVIWENQYSKASDVYSYGFLVYAILHGTIKVVNVTAFKLFKMITDGFRPQIKEDIPPAYVELISKCWSQEPNERPSFSEIVEQLETNKKFVLDSVDTVEFENYIKNLNSYSDKIDKSKRYVQYADFVNSKGKNQSKNLTLDDIINEINNPSEEEEEIVDISLTYLRKLNKNDENDKNKLKPKIIQPNEMKVAPIETGIIKPAQTQPFGQIRMNENDKKNSGKIIEDENVEKIIEDENAVKIIEDENAENIKNKEEQNEGKNKEEQSKPEENDDIKPEENNQQLTGDDIDKSSITHCPEDLFSSLDRASQELVSEAESDSDKQYQVAKNLLYGENNFPQVEEVGLQYLELSMSNQNHSAILLYIYLNMKGEFIAQNLKKAKKLAHKYLKSDDYLYGKICKKEKHFLDAKKCFEKGSKEGHIESMYQYAKMLFLGEGVKKNINKAFKYFFLAKNGGHEKSQYFLNGYQTLNINKEFKNLPPESQFFFISKLIKIQIENKGEIPNSQYDFLEIKSSKLEEFYINNSLQISAFIDCLSSFKHILIHIQFPLKIFNQIFELVSSIQQYSCLNMEIELEITEFKGFETTFSLFQNNLITSIVIGSSVTKIPSKAFLYWKSLKKITMSDSISIIESSAFSGCSNLVEVKIPPLVTSIEQSVFEKCKKLKEIKIGSKVTRIESSAFCKCASLRKVEFEDFSSLTMIGENSFSYCTSLENIHIPMFEGISLKSIFNGCSNKLSVHLVILSDALLIELEQFKDCEMITAVDFQRPSSLMVIADYAFYGCTNLSLISFPPSLVKIGQYAFCACHSLRSLTLPLSIMELGAHAFDECSSLSTATMPQTSIVLGDSVFPTTTKIEYYGKDE